MTPTSTTSPTRGSASRSAFRMSLYCRPASSQPTTMRHFCSIMLVSSRLVVRWSAVGEHPGDGAQTERHRHRAGVGGADTTFRERTSSTDLGPKLSGRLGCLLADLGSGAPRR